MNVSVAFANNTEHCSLERVGTGANRSSELDLDLRLLIRSEKSVRRLDPVDEAWQEFTDDLRVFAGDFNCRLKTARIQDDFGKYLCLSAA